MALGSGTQDGELGVWAAADSRNPASHPCSTLEDPAVTVSFSQTPVGPSVFTPLWGLHLELGEFACLCCAGAIWKCGDTRPQGPHSGQGDGITDKSFSLPVLNYHDSSCTPHSLQEGPLKTLKLTYLSGTSLSEPLLADPSPFPAPPSFFPETSPDHQGNKRAHPTSCHMVCLQSGGAGEGI